MKFNWHITGKMQKMQTLILAMTLDFLYRHCGFAFFSTISRNRSMITIFICDAFRINSSTFEWIAMRCKFTTQFIHLFVEVLKFKEKKEFILFNVRNSSISEEKILEKLRRYILLHLAHLNIRNYSEKKNKKTQNNDLMCELTWSCMQFSQRILVFLQFSTNGKFRFSHIQLLITSIWKQFDRWLLCKNACRTTSSSSLFH